MSASLKWILQITNCDESLADLTLSQLASWDSGMSRADGIACLWGFWALPFKKKKIRCFAFYCLVIHPLLNFFFFSPNSFQTLQWWNLQKDSTHTDRRLRLFSQPVPAHFLTACFLTMSFFVGVRQGLLSMENCVLQCETTGVIVRTSAHLVMKMCDLYGSKVSICRILFAFPKSPELKILL